MTHPQSTSTRKVKSSKAKSSKKAAPKKAAPKKAAPKKAAPKKAASKKAASKKDSSLVGGCAAADSAPVVEESTEPLPRLEATRESIVLWFDKSISDVEKQVKALRASKCPGGKFLKSLNKTLKQLKTKTVRVMGKKPKKRTNVNSGFLKQVPISSEMAKFIGCASSDLKSRVEVTKSICSYIKDNNLQNPADKRQIMPDAKLKKLLRVKSSDDPLTYYRVQSKIKHHFS